jgi:hypothetical protein
MKERDSEDKNKNGGIFPAKLFFRSNLSQSTFLAGIYFFRRSKSILSVNPVYFSPAGTSRFQL